MSDVAVRMDALWDKIRRLSGRCAGSTQLEDLKDYLQKGKSVANGAALLVNDPTVVKKLKEGAEKLGQVAEAIETVTNVCMDLKAITQIHDAIQVLNDPNVSTGSKEAAQAFGQLFVGAGHFAQKLPPPANAYAQILLNCGDFFSNMRRALVPTERSGEGYRWLKQFMETGRDG